MIETAIAIGGALSAFSTGSQHNRLLRISFPRDDGPDSVLLVNTLCAREELSRCFRFEVELLSDDARISLKAMMARMVTISLVRDDGSLRYFNGYVSQFRFVRTDGGFAFYRMILEPWLAAAKLRTDCIWFQGKSVLEITEDTFAQYQQRDWCSLLTEELPQITYASQYNETDYNHLHRRWEAAGLHYWYEHTAESHTLCLSDRSSLAESVEPRNDTDVANDIEFNSNTGSAEHDGISEWQAARRIGSGSMTLTSFDYKNPAPQRASARSRNPQGDVFSYEVHRDTGARGYTSWDDGEATAQRRMDEHDRQGQFFEARSNDRTAQPGRAFTLAGHFSAEPRAPRDGESPQRSIADRPYLIVIVEHEASNNYIAGAGAQSHYDNRFECIDKNILWRPGLRYNSVACADPGVQTAIVVGPPGEAIYTDSYGRVKIQFHWDRVGNNDQQSSAWVRAASPWAGAELGAAAIPRVGSEVIVQYLNGNPDHPIITCCVHNGMKMPPWELASQQALTGLRSRELAPGSGNMAGGRGNHLILDDTNAAIQAQLKSDHACSQLSLGNITRIENTTGRQDARGEGWEIATNAWGVARAGKGMLITTEARDNAALHSKDMGETVQRLVIAHTQHANLADTAQQSGAQESEKQQTAVANANAIKSQTDAVGGGADAGSAFPELARPHLVLASPAGIATTTAQSTHIASDEHTALTTGKSLSIASGDSMFASIRHAFRLFVQKAGIKLIAASGNIDMQALSDSINLLAKLNITHSADKITITAKQEVLIIGGGSYARYGANGIEQGTKAGFTAHAASYSFRDPASMDASVLIPSHGGHDPDGAFIFSA